MQPNDYENKIFLGNCLVQLRQLPDKIANSCVTSPPYYGLRDYGTGEWVGGRSDCDHIKTNHQHGGERKDRDQSAMVIQYAEKCEKCGAVREDDQIGNEKTPEEFIQKLVEVFREIKRILRDDGTIWVNIGDSYAGSGKGRNLDGRSDTEGTLQATNKGTTTGRLLATKTFEGIKSKDLIGIPWMLAFALRADGWYLRQDIIWSKPNPMPESVKDRCTKSHEYIFLLSKNGGNSKIWKSIDTGEWSQNPDLDELVKDEFGDETKRWRGYDYYFDADAIKTVAKEESIARNERGVSDSHKNINGAPGQAPHSFLQPRPNRKQYDKSQGGGGTSFQGHSGNFKADGTPIGDGFANKRSVWHVSTKPYKEAHFATYPEELIEDCIKAGVPEGGLVIDPFMGAGTTAVVARKLNRNYVGCELNEKYLKIANDRLFNEIGLFL